MKDTAGRLKMIRRIVERFSLQSENKEATVSDFVRLVGLEREFEVEERPRAIEVTWIQPTGTEKRK